MTESLPLRARLTADVKEAMKAGEKERLATLRLIGARLKDADIAARPEGNGDVSDDKIVAMLRGMVKSRDESAAMYRDGGRPELAAKEEGEIAVIRGYLPPEMDDAALAAAIAEAVNATGATTMKDMGKVMGALKAKFGANLDLGRANAVVKSTLGG